MTILRHQSASVSLLDVFQPAFLYPELLKQITRRGIESRYRGSALGALWTLLTPLLMLLIYSFVFSVVFKAKWDHPGAQDANFGVILFSGMIIHALFSEILASSASNIIHNPQFVKKVVFPLQLMAWSTMIVASFQALISFGILLLFMLISGMPLHSTLFWFPIIILPMLLFSLGMAWIVSSLTVYIRDIAQIVGILSTVLLFISPIFYSIDRLPLTWQKVIGLNPITHIVNQMRKIVIYGEAPNWVGLGIYTLIALAVAWLGLVIFQRLRIGFADVL